MIESLLHVHWRETWWLLLAALPLVFGGWRRARHERLLRYADAGLLPWAARFSAAQTNGLWRTLAHGLAWGLLALAAAGPRQPLEVQDGQPVPRHRVTVMMVLDVSASMRATDIAPNRLARARLELLDWLPRLQGERVGLVVYAGAAGMLLPPTDDPALLQRALDQVGPNLIEAHGTNLAAALDLARTQLEATPGQARAILLLTDCEAGSVDEPEQAAVDNLRRARLPLFVLGLGSEAGAPVPLPDGGFAELDGVQIQSRMAVSSCSQWAHTTGGRFVAVSDGDADWSALHDRGIAGLPGDPVEAVAAGAWRELYAWCLAPALVLLMMVYMPRRVAALLPLAVLGAMLAPSETWADEAAAWQAWQRKHYAAAQTLYAQSGGYRGQMGAGAAAWRQADNAAAARHFGAALLLAETDRQRADALYNLGNAHYARGQWQAAWEAFETVLRIRPDDGNARSNRGHAWQRLRRQRSDAAMQSDLGGRRGFLAGGRVQMDGQNGRAPDDPDSDPSGVKVGRIAPLVGAASQRGEAAPRSRMAVDPRLAVSGLKKLERLEDRPATMQKNLLKQDARHDDTERPPW